MMDRRVSGMRFEKVDKDVFKKAFLESESGSLQYVFDTNNITDKFIDEIYDNIELPKRSTKGSAGYDFTYPVNMTIIQGMIIYLPTGIRWCSGGEENGFYLSLYPRSSLGIKFSLREPNLVSIIDEDYYGCISNGGHIMLHLKNEGTNGDCFIKAKSGYCQGIISRYYITEDDCTTNIRKGGVGSTTK